MPKVNCAVVGCSGSIYGINKCKKEPCLEQGDKNVVKRQRPNCERIYSVYCFPAEMTKGKERNALIQALKRENTNRTKWTPKGSDKISSLHFVDGIPTKANSLPTMQRKVKHEQRKVKWKLESLTMK